MPTTVSFCSWLRIWQIWIRLDMEAFVIQVCGPLQHWKSHMTYYFSEFFQKDIAKGVSLVCELRKKNETVHARRYVVLVL